MRLLLPFLTHELRASARSLRFRVVAGAWMTGAMVPAVSLAVYAHSNARTVGAPTFLGECLTVLPALSTLAALVLSADGISREREDGSFLVVSLAALSNAGYLLRRWLAILAILLSLSTIPVAGCVLLGMARGVGRIDPVDLLTAWACSSAIPIVIFSALGLAFGTIFGGVIPAVVTTVLLTGLATGFLNGLLARFAMHSDGVSGLVRLQQFGIAGSLVDDRFRKEWAPAMFRSLAPGVPSLAFSAIAPAAIPAAGVALLALAAASRMLRRTRADLRPFRIRPDHPFRTFLGTVAKAREALGVEPAPSRFDLLLLAAGLGAALGGFGWWFARDHHFRAELRERIRANSEKPLQATPPELLPDTWALSGAVGADSSIRTRLETTFRNVGTVPVDRVAFELSRHLELRSASSDGRTVAARRLGRQLEIVIAPAVPPGGSVALSLELAGRAVAVEFPKKIYYLHRAILYDLGRGPVQPLFPDLLPDLTTSRMVPLVSRRRITLDADDLAPVPRYTSWEPKKSSARGELAPGEEAFRPVAEISVDLSTPKHHLVADACGGLGGKEGGELRSRCRLSPASWILRGVPGEIAVQDDEVGTIVALPAHVETSRKVLPDLREVARLARTAWEGIDPWRGSVTLEWPQDPSDDGEPWQYSDNSDTGAGRLFLVDERQPRDSDAFARKRDVAAAAVAESLATLRPLDPREARFWSGFLGGLAKRRLGGQVGAVLLSPIGESDQLKKPIFEAGQWDYWLLAKTPALLAALLARSGEPAFEATLREFLAERGTKPGTAREFLERLGARTGIDFDRFYTDYVEGIALPVLELEAVVQDRHAGTFVVSGRLRNRATGEAVCPLVLRTEGAPIRQMVTVAAGEAVPFRIVSSLAPRVLEIDPKHQCYRYRPLAGIIDRVELAP